MFLKYEEFLNESALVPMSELSTIDCFEHDGKIYTRLDYSFEKSEKYRRVSYDVFVWEPQNRNWSANTTVITVLSNARVNVVENPQLPFLHANIDKLSWVIDCDSTLGHDSNKKVTYHPHNTQNGGVARMSFTKGGNFSEGAPHYEIVANTKSVLVRMHGDEEYFKELKTEKDIEDSVVDILKLLDSIFADSSEVIEILMKSKTKAEFDNSMKNSLPKYRGKIAGKKYDV